MQHSTIGVASISIQACEHTKSIVRRSLTSENLSAARALMSSLYTRRMAIGCGTKRQPTSWLRSIQQTKEICQLIEKHYAHSMMWYIRFQQKRYIPTMR